MDGSGESPHVSGHRASQQRQIDRVAWLRRTARRAEELHRGASRVRRAGVGGGAGEGPRRVRTIREYTRVEGQCSEPPTTDTCAHSSDGADRHGCVCDTAVVLHAQGTPPRTGAYTSRHGAQNQAPPPVSRGVRDFSPFVCARPDAQQKMSRPFAAFKPAVTAYLAPRPPV